MKLVAENFAASLSPSESDAASTEYTLLAHIAHELRGALQNVTEDDVPLRLIELARAVDCRFTDDDSAV